MLITIWLIMAHLCKKLLKMYKEDDSPMISYRRVRSDIIKFYRITQAHCNPKMYIH